jgi:hypothetical protein
VLIRPQDALRACESVLIRGSQYPRVFIFSTLIIPRNPRLKNCAFTRLSISASIGNFICLWRIAVGIMQLAQWSKAKLADKACFSSGLRREHILAETFVFSSCLCDFVVKVIIVIRDKISIHKS